MFSAHEGSSWKFLNEGVDEEFALTMAGLMSWFIMVIFVHIIRVHSGQTSE